MNKWVVIVDIGIEYMNAFGPSDYMYKSYVYTNTS